MEKSIWKFNIAIEHGRRNSLPEASGWLVLRGQISL